MSRPDPPRLRLFEETEQALFLDRPNRFVVNCILKGEKLPAYLPNPGRLRELLLPQRTLHLSRNKKPGKFTHTVVAVEREGHPILLHTHLANRVVEWLLREKAVPGYENTIIMKREAVSGNSRFDFLLEREGRNVLIEVKSCTLFEGSVAMFPDAVTARGRKHLLELAREARKGTEGGVIVLINAPNARWFLPDYHTDLEFARAMLSVRRDVPFTPLSVGWEDDLSITAPVGRAHVPWDMVEREARDGGSYILVLRLDRDHTIQVGKLGTISFEKGHYCYVGSAATDLTKRIHRHLRKRKTLHWHIDCLRNEADAVSALPVRSSERLECSIARALARVSGQPIRGFGSSDCRCETHLFAMEGDPNHDEAFVNLLQYFRIGRLEGILEDRGNETP